MTFPWHPAVEKRCASGGRAEAISYLVELQNARMALISSNRPLVANLEHEAAQMRASLRRQESPQVEALLRQNMARIQPLPAATNLPAAALNPSGTTQ